MHVQMFLFVCTPKKQLKSVLPNIISSHRSALRIGRLSSHTVRTTIHSRSAASKSSSNVPRIPKADIPRRPPSIGPPRNPASNIVELQARQGNPLTTKLVNTGRVVLFRAQSHAGFMFAAWVGGITCVGGALLILHLKLHEENKELPWFVPISYRIVIVFLVAVGSWSIIRSSRLISSIEMLRLNGKAQLVLKVRRNIPLPFIRPKEITVDASDVVLQRQMVTPMGRPPRDPRSFTGIASRIGAVPHRFFTSARQFIFSDGIIQLSVLGRDGKWKVDSNGLFLDHGKLLFDVVKFDS